MQTSGNLLYHLVAFSVVAIWGSTFISTKVLIAHGISPAQIFTIRFGIAYLLMLLVSHKQIFTKSLKDELLMVALGVTGGSAYFLTENEALRFSTATNVSLIVCSCPLFTMILYRLVFKNIRLSRRQMISTILAFVGMAVVVFNGRFVLHLSPVGDSLALAACLCWAFYSLLMKYATEHYSSTFITRKVFFYGLLFVLPYYLIDPHFPSFTQLTQPVVMYNLLFLGCIASMLCFLAWTWAIFHLGAIKTTNYVYVNPVTTIIFAAWILNEKITSFFILGSVLIMIGLYLSNKKEQSTLEGQLPF